MARPVPIGDYEPQVPVEEGLRRIIPQRSGVSTGPALEDVGNSLQRLATSEAAQYTTQALAQTQTQWTQHFIDRQQSAAPGAPGFTPALMKDYNDYVQKTVDGAPNQIAGRMLQSRLADFGARLQDNSLRFEAGARQTHNENTAKEAIDVSAAEIQNDPTIYDDRLAQNTWSINSMSMEPQAKEQLARYARQTLSGAAVRGDINRDPYKAMLAINDPNAKGYYADLSSEQREQLMTHADQMLHQRVADAERVHMLAKQEQEDNSNKLLKQGITMETQGSLTAEWVIGHSASLEPAAMKYLLEAASGKKSESDPRVYSDLLTRTVRGEDTQQDILSAFGDGQLSKEDFTRLTDKTATEFPNSYKRGLNYINTAGKVSELEPDPAKAQTLANMQNDFQDWFRKNGQEANDQEVQQEAINVVKRYQLVRADQNLLTLPVPQFGLGKGTRAAPDIQGAKHDLVQALTLGQINRDDFNKQAALLQQWERAANISAQKKAAAKAQQQ